MKFDWQLFRPHISIVVALITAGFLLYWTVSNFEFLTFDDNLYVTENPHVLQGITGDGLYWALTSEHGAHWHPLSFISHMIDVQLFGLDAGSHHMVNVAWHAANVSLLYLFFSLLTGWSVGSALAALFFLVHPMRIESVAWLSERKDVLSMFFLLATLTLYVLYLRFNSRAAYGISLFTCVLSLLAKPSAIVIPALLILLDLWPFQRISRGMNRREMFHAVLDKIPYVIITFVCAALAIWAQSKGGGMKSLSDYPLWLRIDSVLIGYLSYAGKFFFPAEYAIFYPFSIYQPGVSSGALLGLLSISLLVVLYRREAPSLLIGWIWFLASLIPVIGIVQIGGQAFADRWSYLAHVGLLLGILGFVQTQKGRLFWGAIVMILSLLFACITHSNLKYWKSSEAVYTHAIEVAPNNFIAHNNLGALLDQQGKMQEAGQHFEEAVRIAPQYSNALVNLAGIRLRERRFDEAEELLMTAKNLSDSPLQLKLRALLYQEQEQNLEAMIVWIRFLLKYPDKMPAPNPLDVLLARFFQKGCSMISGVSPQVPDRHLDLRTQLQGLVEHNSEKFSSPQKLALEKVLICIQ